MPDENQNRIDLLQGTLDMLILKTLILGPLHGHGIAKHIERTSEDVLGVPHGSLYPALHRLERQGWINSSWQKADKGREMKFYRLTPAGRRQLAVEDSKWAQMAAAIARVLRPA